MINKACRVTCGKWPQIVGTALGAGLAGLAEQRLILLPVSECFAQIHRLQQSEVELSERFSAFWVSKIITTAGMHIPWCFGHSLDQNDIMTFNFWEAGSLIRVVKRGVGDYGIATDGPPTFTWNYYVLTSTGTNVTLRENGTVIINNADINTPFSGNLFTLGTLGCYRAGPDPSINSWMKGYLAEDGWYDNEISSDSVTLLETYLGTRYPSA